jgi:endoglucanase
VIGQGGATDTAFVALWAAIAKKYAKESYVIFGLMNEISSGTSYAINSEIYSINACPSNLTPRRLWPISCSHMERQYLGYNFAGGCNRNCESYPHWASFKKLTERQRTAGAISQFILLRGYDWTGTTSFQAASGNALAAITNPDGPIGKLIFDFQKYFDSGTGTSAECVSSYITDGFAPAAQWLRCHGRQALLVR